MDKPMHVTYGKDFENLIEQEYQKNREALNKKDRETEELQRELLDMQLLELKQKNPTLYRNYIAAKKHHELIMDNVAKMQTQDKSNEPLFSEQYKRDLEKRFGSKETRKSNYFDAVMKSNYGFNK